MYKVLITGGAGFLGKKLARKLLARGQLGGRRIDRLVLLDMAEPGGLQDPRLEIITGDLADPSLIARAIDCDTHSVYNLAAVVRGAAEADFALGLLGNLDASS